MRRVPVRFCCLLGVCLSAASAFGQSTLIDAGTILNSDQPKAEAEGPDDFELRVLDHRIGKYEAAVMDLWDRMVEYDSGRMGFVKDESKAEFLDQTQRRIAGLTEKVKTLRQERAELSKRSAGIGPLTDESSRLFLPSSNEVVPSEGFLPVDPTPTPVPDINTPAVTEEPSTMQSELDRLRKENADLRKELEHLKTHQKSGKARRNKAAPKGEAAVEWQKSDPKESPRF